MRSTAYDPEIHTGRLHRLYPAYYTGGAFVHWSMNIKNRRRGWLTPAHHASVRELLCYTLMQHRLICPGYCLMPDHAHFLLMGCHLKSDQLLAVGTLRRTWNILLQTKGFELDRQAYDRVLREKERARGAFPAACAYVLANPQVEKLVEDWRSYRYLGALVPGRCDLDPRSSEFWPQFWRVHSSIVRINAKI
jgi:REP element-mobilizing transposase RayT